MARASMKMTTKGTSFRGRAAYFTKQYKYNQTQKDQITQVHNQLIYVRKTAARLIDKVEAWGVIFNVCTLFYIIIPIAIAILLHPNRAMKTEGTSEKACIRTLSLEHMPSRRLRRLMVSPDSSKEGFGFRFISKQSNRWFDGIREAAAVVSVGWCC